MTYTPKEWKRGYTLVELIVAIGLFAIIMTLATGAYLVMIAANRQTQGLATGINNLSFVLDSVTTAMRTGSAYCDQNSCTDGVQTQTFSYRDQKGNYVRYGLINVTANGVTVKSVASCTNPAAALAYCAPNTPLTDAAVNVTSLTFLPQGTVRGDAARLQPYVTIYMAGTVTVAPGKTQTFAIESSVIMRGSDI